MRRLQDANATAKGTIERATTRDTIVDLVDIRDEGRVKDEDEDKAEVEDIQNKVMKTITNRAGMQSDMVTIVSMAHAIIANNRDTE